MTIRDTPFTPGTPCWVDLYTSDTTKSKTFYSAVLGWEFGDANEEFGGYVNVLSDRRLVAGLMGGNTAESGIPDGWTTYLATDDAEATVKAVLGAGGTVSSEPMPVADLGTMAILADSVGTHFGIWQAGKHTGFTKYNEPGSVGWDELHSKDYQKSLEFYTEVFGWTLNTIGDSDEFRYSTGQIDGQDVAGVMNSAGFLPPETPSHWAVYFSVDDVDAAVATSVALGGQVLRAAEDSPFGRIADMRDSTGANFKLHSTKLKG